MDRSMLKHKDIFGAGMPTPFLHADGSTPFRFDQDSTPEKYYQNHPEETAAGFRFDVYSTPKKYDDTFGTGGNFASWWKDILSNPGSDDNSGFDILKLKDELLGKPISKANIQGLQSTPRAQEQIGKLPISDVKEMPTGNPLNKYNPQPIAAGVIKDMINAISNVASKVVSSGNASGNKAQSGAGAGNEVLPNEPNSGATPNTGLIIGLSVGIGLITVSGIIYFATRKK